MTIPFEMPLDRALAKRDRLENRLKKCPVSMAGMHDVAHARPESFMA